MNGVKDEEPVEEETKEASAINTMPILVKEATKVAFELNISIDEESNNSPDLNQSDTMPVPGSPTGILNISIDEEANNSPDLNQSDTMPVPGSPTGILNSSIILQESPHEPLKCNAGHRMRMIWES